MADTDRIGETLRKRVLQDGIDFLGQEGRVNGILADMFPDQFTVTEDFLQKHLKTHLKPLIDQ